MKKGFTLIELLVVIAIIGILAAIVLVSLSGARNSAKDARIQADMAQVRTIAETYYIETGDYDGINLETSSVSIVTDIAGANGQGPESPFWATNTTGYCAAAKLNSGNYWCVDSALHSKSYTADPANCIPNPVAGDPRCE